MCSSVWAQWDYKPGLRVAEDVSVDCVLLPVDFWREQTLTAGWSIPRVFSLIASASFNRLAASLYLFWSLQKRRKKSGSFHLILPSSFRWRKTSHGLNFTHRYTSANIFSMVATSGWVWPDDFSRSSKACWDVSEITWLHLIGSRLNKTNLN